uniref:Astrotactin 2 n=1 Tax=Paramormyrops kingsleyae TaxID=1676925 RepID=A0A3B3S2I1_9TELE
MASRVIFAFKTVVLLGVLLIQTGTMGRSRSTGLFAAKRDGDPGAESPCEVKTVTVSTLPVLRENEFSFTSGGSGSLSGGVGDSQLLLLVRTDVPGKITVLDDLENTALPFFTLEMSGTGIEVSLVHWKQRWLDNGTLYFHVSLSGAEQLAQVTEPTERELAHVLHEHAHLLHVSVMGSLIALLLLVLLFAMVLYARRHWCKRRHVPQKRGSTEATHEIHYIPSVLLGPQGRDGFHNSRLQPPDPVISMSIRETPILDDYDCEEDERLGQNIDRTKVTHTMERMYKTEDSHKPVDPKQETVETLMLKFKESFRTNTPVEITHLQQVTCSAYTGRKRRRSHCRGGPVFGQPEDSGSEADDEAQMKFYTAHQRGRRRSKGAVRSPVNKATLTLLTISMCISAVVYSSQLSCPLTVKVILHVPEHFVADGSIFVVSMGSYLDVSDWLNPAKLVLYYQTNSSSQWVRDYCGQRTTTPCEQLCDPDSGECSCHEGYSPDPVHKHLCVRSNWGHNEGPWPYSNLEKGYDLVTGEQAPEKIFRSTYGLGQGLWLPVSKSFVVPPVELSINPIASCKTDVLVTDDPGDVREESIRSTHFETVDDLLSSFGPVRDCSKDNGGCRKNFKCVSDRRLDSSGCVCPEGLRPMKDGSGCYDYSKGTDCSDGFNGGCEQLCLQQVLPLPDDPSSSNVYMFCGCVEEYRLAPDGRSCMMQTDMCDRPSCHRQNTIVNSTLFGEMLHGYNNKSQQVNLGQIFQMSFRDNNYIKDFPQLADGLMVIPLPVEEQCRGMLSEPQANLHLLTGDAKFNEALGYPMVQQWRVRSNLYKVKLSSITLSAGFSKVLKMLNSESTREELLSFIEQYGTHYVSEALYGSDLTCTIYFPSKKVQQQLWLQYQKETTDAGSRRELRSMPFITYLTGLLAAQQLAEDQLVSGVDIHCEEKGQCPVTCHLCRHSGREQTGPTPVLLEVTRIVPLYSLVQDNITKEAFKSATMSSYWCAGKGDVIENWCRCDLSAFSKDGLPNCSPLRQPVLRLAPHLEPSSTMVALEWLDVEPLIGCKVSDYIIQHKKVEDQSEAEIYTGEVLSFAEDLLAGLGSSCVVAGKRYSDHPASILYSLIFKCLEPDSLYKFTLHAIDSRGRHSESSFVFVRTSCPVVDDNMAEEIADKVYNLYNGYTSGKEQQMAYNTLMDIPPPMLYRVQYHYDSHYERFGDFVWRSEDELGPRKAHLILRRVDHISRFCGALLRSAYIRSRTDTVPYAFCRSDETRPSSSVWHSSLQETRVSCVEKIMSIPRNTYAESKLR